MRCPCGGVILADTEDWETPLCYDCYQEKEPTMISDDCKGVDRSNGLSDEELDKKAEKDFEDDIDVPEDERFGYLIGYKAGYRQAEKDTPEYFLERIEKLGREKAELLDDLRQAPKSRSQMRRLDVHKDAKIRELEAKVERAKSFIEMIAHWDYPNSLKGRASEQIDWAVFKAAEALKEIEGSGE